MRKVLVIVAVLAACGCQGRRRGAPAVQAADDPAVTQAAPAQLAPAAAQPAAVAQPQAAAAAAEEPADYKPEDPPVAAQAPAAAPAPAAQPAAADLPRAEPKEAIVDSEPPDPVYEEPGRSPAPGRVWTPGYWDHVGSRWLWSHGAWRVRPPGLSYVSPHYEIVNGRVVYVRPHWGSTAVMRTYGGRALIFRTPIRPATYRPGFRYVVSPVLGYRVGSRPVAIYRNVPATRQIVVPARVVVRPGVGMHPGVVVRPGVVVGHPVPVARPGVVVHPVGRPGVVVRPVHVPPPAKGHRH
jgi:hypothetical protein